MDHFHLRNGELYAEDVPLARIAEEVGTPVYVYSRATLERHARVFRDGLAGVGGVAGQLILIDHPAIVEAADRLGLFVWGESR